MTRTFFVFLIFSPLLYASDGDEFREEKILAVAAIAIMPFLLWPEKRILRSVYREICVVGLYALLVVIQQLVIDNGSLLFGVKYAVTILAVFVPYWTAQSSSVFTGKLEKSIADAISAIFVITIVSIYLSYFFDLGEVYEVYGGAKRALGWLGDSYTPIVVFFVFLNVFRKRYDYVGLALIALLMTGGKAGILMLALSPIIFAFSVSSARVKFRIAMVYLVVVGLLVSFSGPIYAKLVESSLINYSYNNRILSFYVGIDHFINNPLIGIGVNQSMAFIGDDSAWLADWLGVNLFFEIYQIHNAFIRTAAETGLIGLILLIVLCVLLLSPAFRTLSAAKKMPPGYARAIVLASSLWVITFVLFYQTTGWFEAGHPQLSWLLLFSTLSNVLYRRWTFKNLARYGRRKNARNGQ